MRAALALGLCAAVAGCGDSVASPAGGTTLWGRRFGKSTGMDPVAVAAGGAGDVVVGGRFFATADFGGGPVQSPANNWQGFLARYDGDGDLAWMRSIGDIFEERVTHVAFDGAGNVVVAGTFRGTIDLGGDPLESEGPGVDLFVAKLAPDGSPLWRKRIGGGGDDVLRGMAVGADGGVALLGDVGNGADFGAGPTTFNGVSFLARLEPGGEVAYATALEFPGELYITSPIALGVDSAGAVVVTAMQYRDVGRVLRVAKLGKAGEPAWVRDFTSIGEGTWVTSLSVAADDAIFLSGSRGDGILNLGGGVTLPAGEASFGVFIAALASDGAPRWVRGFSPRSGRVDELGNPLPAALSANAVAAVSGGVVLTGSFTGEVDLGGGARQSAGQTQVNQYGYHYGYGNDDVFAVKLDGGGAHLWDATFGNTKQQAGTSVGADPAGDVFIAGWASGGLPFGDGGFADTSYYDGFLVKLAR